MHVIRFRKLETYYKAQKQNRLSELHFRSILLGFFERISSTYISFNFAEFILQRGILLKRKGFELTPYETKIGFIIQFGDYKNFMIKLRRYIIQIT